MLSSDESTPSRTDDDQAACHVDQGEGAAMVVGFDPRHHLDWGGSVSGMEQRFDAGVETSRQRGATFGVERATQMNHAVGVVPDFQIRGPALPFETAQPAIGLSPSHFDTHGFGELVDRQALRVGQQTVATVDETDLVGW